MAHRILSVMSRRLPPRYKPSLHHVAGTGGRHGHGVQAQDVPGFSVLVEAHGAHRVDVASWSVINISSGNSDGGAFIDGSAAEAGALKGWG